MTDRGADSKLFAEVTRELLQQGLCVRFQACGASMSPAIRDREFVQVTPVIVSKLRKDDIVLTSSKNGFRLHRIVVADHVRDEFVTRGDCGQENDPTLKGAQILGLAQAKEVHVGRKVVQANFRGVGGWTLRSAARAQYIFSKALQLVTLGRSQTGVASSARTTSQTVLGILGLSLILLAAPYLRAQVAVDASSSRATERTGAGTVTDNFVHTTSNGANRLLIVGVAMNISTAPGTGVVGIKYGGVSLNFVGAQNDAGGTRRVEMWYLLNPASGANVATNVSVNIPTAGATVGIVAGATTFTGVDQTVPLGAFVSAAGAAGANSQLDVPSVVNGMIL